MDLVADVQDEHVEQLRRHASRQELRVQLVHRAHFAPLVSSRHFFLETTETGSRVNARDETRQNETGRPGREGTRQSDAKRDGADGKGGDKARRCETGRDELKQGEVRRAMMSNQVPNSLVCKIVGQF